MPGLKFVDEVVAREDEFLGCKLPGLAEGGGRGGGGEGRYYVLAEFVEGAVQDVHCFCCRNSRGKGR